MMLYLLLLPLLSLLITASPVRLLKRRMQPGWCTFHASVQQNCQFQGKDRDGFKYYNIQIKYIKDNSSADIPDLNGIGHFQNRHDDHFTNITVSIAPEVISTSSSISESTSASSALGRRDDAPTATPPTPTPSETLATPTNPTDANLLSATSTKSTPSPTPTPRYIQYFSITSNNTDLKQNLTFAHDEVLDVVMFDYGGNKWNDTDQWIDDAAAAPKKGCKKGGWGYTDEDKPDCRVFWRSVYREMDCRFAC